MLGAVCGVVVSPAGLGIFVAGHAGGEDGGLSVLLPV